SKMYFGDTKRNESVFDYKAWQEFGLDLDHRASTAKSCGLCRPSYGTLTENVQPDGLGGADNGFGSSLLPVLMTFIPANYDAGADSWLLPADAGAFLIRIDNLGDSPNVVSVAGSFFHAAPLGSPPKWDGTDAWSVTSDSLLDPSDPNGAKVTFKDGY